VTNRDCALLAFKLLGLWLIASAAIGVASCPTSGIRVLRKCAAGPHSLCFCRLSSPSVWGRLSGSVQTGSRIASSRVRLPVPEGPSVETCCSVSLFRWLACSS